MTQAARRLLIVNRVFPPDPGATGRLAADLAEAAASAGWQVDILACGRVSETRPVTAAVRLTRVAAPPGRSIVSSLRQTAALWRGARRRTGATVVVLMSDPPFAWSIAGAFRGSSVAIIHWVQDLYPEVLPALGVRLPSLARRVLVEWRRRVMMGGAGVVAVGACMAKRLVESGLPQALARPVANWPDRAVRPDPMASVRWRLRHGISDCDLVLLAGRLGRSMPAEALGAIADRLAALLPSALLLVAGDGAKAGVVDRLAVSRPNLVRLAPVPSEELSAMLGAADVHLVLQSADTGGFLVPSRLLSALASGRPVIAAVPGWCEAARQALRVAGNLVVDTSERMDPEAIARAIVARLADRSAGVAEPPADPFDARQPLTDWLALLEEAVGASAGRFR